MGMFGDLFKSVPQATYSYKPVNEQEAWIGIFYAIMAVDGNVADSEIDTMSKLVVFKKWFTNVPLIDYYRNAQFANQKIGNKGLIDACIPLISPELKATLFALCMELVMADGTLEDKEQEIIKVIAESLNMDPDLTKNIVEVMMIKNNGNVIVN
jgi:uncharacterized tellurite resistance protein B-like protein